MPSSFRKTNEEKKKREEKKRRGTKEEKMFRGVGRERMGITNLDRE